MNVLVTGGAGYIGSHAALRLLEAGHAVTVIDDLSRGNDAVVNILSAEGDFHFAQGDIGDAPLVKSLLCDREIDLVMHFAAKAYVGESVEMPLHYYRNNAASALTLLEMMDEVGVTRMVFSSTCATYGEPLSENIPISETCPQEPINPYGRSKLHVEHMLFDYAHMMQKAGKDFAFAALRYFNVAGNDDKCRLGEDHKPETHLIPICLEAALGQRPEVTIFGRDYPTDDGTCIRDYVQVDDLIAAHILVMDALQSGDMRTYNVGIGHGYSVREVIDACHRVTGVDFAVSDGARRPGDPPMLFNNPSKIQQELGWTARYTNLDDVIRTAWEWRQKHPHGYTPTPPH